MVFNLKFFLPLFGFAGVSSAVGVPLVLRSSGGGDSNYGIETEAKYQFPLTKCQKGELQFSDEISYGEKGVKEVCWELSSGGGNADLSDVTGEGYDSLFKATWDKTDREWQGQSYGAWTQQCSSVSDPWVILSDQEQMKYMGLCDNKSSENALFVKKKIESETGGQKTTLWICDKDCWETSNETMSESKVLKQEKTGQWKPIKFKGKKIDSK